MFLSPDLSHGQIFKSSSTIDYALFKGQHAPSKELLSQLGLEARWDDESGPSNPSGLTLNFEKVAGTGGNGSHGPARYRIFAAGAAENKVFSFGTWPLNKNLTNDPQDLYVNGQGLLMRHQPTSDEDLSMSSPDEFEVSPVTVTAEPVRYLLARRDGELRIYATLVPHPLVDNEQGCMVEVRLAQPAAKSVLVILDGFPSKDKIPLVLESAGASVSKIVDTDDNGHGVMAVFPFVPGKTEGILKASAEGPNCLPSVSLPWGPVAPAAPVAAAKPASH